MRSTLSGIKAYFESALPDVLGEIKADWDVVIPAWKHLETHRIKDRQYPAVEILPGTVDYDYLEEDTQLVPGWEYHTVNIEVRQVGSEYADVQDNVLCYVEGIRRVTNDDCTYGNRFNRVRLVSVDPGEIPEAQKTGRLLQKAIVILQVRVEGER